MSYFRRLYDLGYRIVKVRGIGGIPCVMDSITYERKLDCFVPISLNAPNDIACKCCILDTDAYISIKHWEI